MNRSVYKVAIANRGEIAVRIVTACKEMGIKTVLLHSAADRNSRSVKLSDEAICIGPADPIKSYLNIQAIMQATLSSGADALHPGYGFLSENFALAEALEKAKIIFIGPRSNHLKLFGNKVLTRKLAEKCGIPVLPAHLQCQVEKAREIGFPIVIKALHGGGGRGVRVVRTEKHFVEALNSAQREIQKSFGKDTLFIEKFLFSPRHIEVQVFADASGKIHYLWDRDCSIQKNHQKIIEEAPATAIPNNCREQMAEAALKLMKEVDYRQAGTVEFLYQDEKFYFIEVNPRLQVEHPVTEMILGLDLVKAQILTARNIFPFEPAHFHPKGHSIQCRIYAENMQQMCPSVGTLAYFSFPSGAGRRADTGFELGDEISEFYDPMLGKMLVWDETRSRAIKRMQQALNEIIIFGVKTNVSFLKDILSHKKFLSSQMDTNFVQEEFLKTWKEKSMLALDSKIISSVLDAFSISQEFNKTNCKKFNPWTYYETSKQ